MLDIIIYLFKIFVSLAVAAQLSLLMTNGKFTKDFKKLIKVMFPQSVDVSGMEYIILVR